jgi:hypothetical protein
MDKLEREMIAVVNRNHDIKALAERLNAISARRKKKGAKK